MKTQRPRATVARRSGPDKDRQPNGSQSSQGPDGNYDTLDSPQASTAKAAPPALPKRKAASASTQAQSSVATPEVAQPAATKPVSSAQRASNPATMAPTATAAPVTEAGGRGWRAIVTYENLFWLGIFLVALVSRFYNLDPRALHHDESLHAVYSRNLYIGTGYQHDPMMHGPLQFHFIGLMYWLFGATDGTARFASVVSGIFVVMSPFFLKRQMGRLTALICGFLLLVAPSILYFSRMAREDAIFSGMEMIMIVGLWRFISTRKPGDFYIFCAGLSLMFTIKETAYLSVAVLGGLFAILFALQAGYAILGALGGYLAVLGGFYVFANSQMKSGGMPHLPNIPDTNPNWDTITRFASLFLTHPLVLGVLVITLIFIAVLVTLFRIKRQEIRHSRPHRSSAGQPRRKVSGTVAVRGQSADNGATVPLASPEGSGNGYEANVGAQEATAATTVATSGNGAESAPNGAAPAAVSEADEIPPAWDTRALRPKRGTLLAHYEAGSMPYIVGALFSRPSVLLIGFGIAAAIFTVLYTVFFTDVPRGIASGLFASLGYWMAQHDVERGGQPWFFYIVIIPLYEPIAAFFASVGTIFFSWRGVRWLVRKIRDRRHSDEPGLSWYNTDRPVPFASFNAFLPLFIGWWLFGALVIYSWAGEKMPWLMMHTVRPAIFMASLFLGSLIASMLVRRRKRLAQAGWLDRRDSRYDADYDDEYDTPIQPRRRAAGALFSLGAARRWATNSGLLARKPAYANVPATTMEYSAARGSRSMGGSSRRSMRGYMPARYRQEPPWVSWNRPDSVFPFASFLVLFILLAFAWGLSMSQVRYDAINNRPGGGWNSWAYTWVFPAMMMVMLVSYSIWLGVGRAMRYFALGIVSVFLIYQFRSGFMLSYRQPDVSTELASYVQTSPDVTRVVKELEDFSYLTTGGKNVKVVYDSEVSWPFEWYLRDYTNKSFIGGGTPTPSADVPVMFVGYNHLNNAEMLEQYIAQRYALRWWFPEEWYKNELLPNQFVKDANGQTVNDPATGQAMEASSLAQVGDLLHTIGVTFTEPQLQAQLWNYLMYREPPKPLGSTDFVLFVRKDVAQLWHNLQNRPLPSTDVP